MTHIGLDYQSIFDHLYDGVYFVDHDRRITYWNPAAELITGFTAAEVVGKHCSDNILMHVDEKGVNLCENGCPLALTLQDSNYREAEFFLHHKKGHRVPVAIRISPLKDLDGKLVGAVELFSDSSPKKAIMQQVTELTKLAMLDNLTQLANRRYLEMELQARLDEFKRYHMPFALVFMDIDHFKKLNDTHGHNAGDQVLQMVAKTLSINARSFDLVGRWGGEEFVAILRNVDREAMQQIADRFRNLVAKASLQYGGENLQITISLGGTLAIPGDTMESLVQRADALMYHSKNHGRNRLSIDMDKEGIVPCHGGSDDCQKPPCGDHPDNSKGSSR
ncbi:sensor domain-containing diguanylate cyclase [Desulfuromonas sp. AOP6]|uniref:sensor domain-containing diguanylate cyclase n=1 Tax=Desulfuromonas sp. AOP6 TaxID=1566351 RepID=UPI001274E662|nr:sensor domain-containing diguanylate cyclase [Desulfuromonas sp. AOP6]BCA81080.1 diguanylate cyclase [Desulfuromonas sp. AOP6]